MKRLHLGQNLDTNGATWAEFAKRVQGNPNHEINVAARNTGHTHVYVTGPGEAVLAEWEVPA